jgi:DNA-directed RNA polymerase specialized sigma24 family protein
VTDDGQNADGPHGVYEAMHAHLVTTRDPSRPRSIPLRPQVLSEPPRPSEAPTPGETVPAGSGSATGEHAAVVDGFSDFYRTTWPGVARALAVALGDRDLAVDATDEAMARAYPRWATLSGYDNPGAWVYRVGLNWARSHRRRLARRLPFAHPTEAVPVPVADPAVRDALLALPVKLRSVVVCRLLLDWSVDDTATALGVRPGTVQSRLHRAIRSLHASLDHLR